ncbi:MAG: hypothetical protein K8S54_16305 [Spirochaetia bacterium]|nr:hypothetical protein [Spirochaetia bacterium]
MRKTLLLLAFLLVPVVAFSQAKSDLNDQKTPAPKLSEEEIRTGRVEFINASNLPATEAARRQSVEAGKALADSVIATGQGSKDGIQIKRVYDKDAAGFGADILTIDAKANFAHINAVQRIIQGYAQQAFEYNAADSVTMSQFILYYNAKQRGGLDKLKGKYTDKVIGSLTPDKVGIDRSYKNWAGKTEIIIPLVKNVVRPCKTDVNTTEIKKETTDAKKEDTKKLQEIEDKRKQETTTKLDQKEQDLKKQQTSIDQKKQDIQKQQETVQQQKQDTGKKLQELNKDPVKNAAEIKKEEAKQQDIKKQETELKKQEDTVKKEEQKVKEEAKEVKDQKEAKTEPAKTEPTKTEPAKTEDQKKVETLTQQNEEMKKQAEDKEKKSENVVGDKIVFLRFIKYHSEGHYSNELWMLDPVKDDTLFKSPFTNICGREFIVVPGQGILVIGYENGSDAHTLAMLDQEKLGLKTRSKESVYWRSPLILRDNKIYGIEIKDGQYYLTRFNPDLSMDARSSEPISGDSDITFYNEKIYVTGKAQGAGATTIKAFNRKDLTHMKTITPPN